MFRNLIKVAFRNIRKEKFFSLLNIAGLAVGTCCVLFISLYIADERSFDKFHENADRIYRINQTFIWGDDDNLFGSTGPNVAEAVRTEIPEFEEVTRVHTPGSRAISYEKRVPYVVFEEEGLFAVDENFLRVFTFPLISGDKKTAFKEPFSIALTESTAQKYFGNENAIGELLMVGEGENKTAYTVTAVMQDVPTNSHIDFDVLISMKSIPRVEKDGWSWIWTTFVTFGLLDENADPENIQLAQRLEQTPRKHAGASLQRLQKMTFEEWEADGKEWKLYHQPLLDIHLYSSDVYSRLNQTGDIKMVYIFGTIGLLIFLMCLINFINLTTARSFGRAKEIGIRKVVGSSKEGLIFQFLAESILVCAFAILLGAFMLEWLLPLFNTLSGKDISFAILQRPGLLALLCLSPFVVGALAGLYPAFFMTAFPTIRSLKNKVGEGGGNSSFRNTLVVLQFAVSIIFIASTIIVFNQLAYQRNLHLGFDRSNKLIIEQADRLGNSLETFRSEVAGLRKVEGVSVSDATPPYIYNFDNFRLKGSTQSEFPLNYIKADEYFMDIYGLQLLSGRAFQEGFNEQNRGLVNEAMVRYFGFESNEEIIGKKLAYYDAEMEVIGVFNDFNASYTSQLRPFAIFYESSDLFGIPGSQLSISFSENLSGDEITALLQDIEERWASMSNNSLFEYAFLDQTYEATFRPTVLFGKILSTFAVLAIFIAVLGLVGLVTYIIEKRSKEIGVRKVLGASVGHILYILSGRFGVLLLLAFVLAIPITWYGMDIWLEDFEQRRPIQLIDFALGGGLMLVITMAATSFQTIRASLTNPINVLKDE